MPSKAYKDTGVDYDVLDAGKRRASAAAAATSGLMRARGATAVEASRGEPAFVWSMGDTSYALVLECLGTKSLVAEEVFLDTRTNLFDVVGYDTVAAAVNDLVCVGALPIAINAYFAAGNSAWFASPRLKTLVKGFELGCRDAGVTWGGGESPALSGVVADQSIDLAAAAVGVVDASGPLLGADLRAGDSIVIVESSGIHANGASLARHIASTLPNGWRTRVGRSSLGRAVLERTTMYSRLVERVLPLGGIKYFSNVTGHGALKLMRANADDVSYVLSSLPAVPKVLGYLAEEAGLDDRDAYTTFNMGLGFAVYCTDEVAPKVVDVATTAGYRAKVRGRVEKGPKRVVLEPLDIEYGADELELR